jgi:hypothetical protein
MRCVKIKHIETFPIYKKFIFIINLQEIASFYSLKVNFTFKISSFCMDFLTNHMSTYIYYCFKNKHIGMHIG